MAQRPPLWALTALSFLRPGPRVVCNGIVFGALLAASGCATKGGDVHQFAPMPRVEMGQTELGPVSTRPVAQLLREAEQAYQAADAAQKAGDRAGAMRHY